MLFTQRCTRVNMARHKTVSVESTQWTKIAFRCVNKRFGRKQINPEVE